MSMIPALSPANNDQLVRWPPQGYDFDESRYKHVNGEGYQRDADILRGLYPEISHWKNASLLHAWFDYGESTNYAALSVDEVSKVRDRYFLAFLYAKQELGTVFDHGGLDEFDSTWKSLGK
ncbi:hypothetical protein [Cellvibrio sp. QJXJ]|uniref:hypothetical protein n=1 Tax=Cellvibrio sp. QJXJ TaxID=2964606 RepID=UPI0021C2BF77|nr:hypothetical protein [Cellvibrio sp. QJXJ]UUA75228.1 hypothetical protein NNX04_22480 [Cellvibrio sp. QJXJ]